RNPHRHQGDNRGNQIKHGVQSFRKNAQAACGHTDDNLEGGDGQRRQNGVASHSPLFGAHGLRTVNRGRSRHSGIIAVGRASDFGRQTSGGGPWPLGVVRVSPRRICYVLRNSCCKVHGDHQPDPSPISRSFSPRWSIHPHALILMRFKQGRKLCMHRATRSFVIAALTVASATLGAQAQSAPIKPGLWEIHSEREVNGQKPQDASDRMKRMSPEKRARFEAMMKEHGVATDGSGKSQVCYTKENLDQSAWASQAMDCKATFSSRTANFWKWHTSCPQMGVEADGEAHFPNSENYTVKSASVSKRGDKALNSSTTMTGKWL